jgi:photosystem II stability/assembly factor-like uncharacterized protein
MHSRIAAIIAITIAAAGAPARAQDALDTPADPPQPIRLADPPEAEDIPEPPTGDSQPTVKKLSASTFTALRARGIGPALMSGRISDIAVNPRDHSEFYVAAASGGVWKTTNRGVSFSPVFDDQGSYSIGCLAIDPSNTNVVWVGTGENKSQRSVSFGDGVYRSADGGRSWTNMGLKESEHIGMIAIDPRDGDTVYVAAQGPLWRAGRERGLYKTTDGGRSWQRILHISDDTGISEVHLDPRDPDTIYAPAYQRRRKQWTLVDGGPESAIYKSTDAGVTWEKINRGLPDGDLGRIGMAVSPADPDVLYAIVAATEDRSAFYRSANQGENWQRMASYKTSSPQYYNEVFADPSDVNRVYLADTFLQISEDGGRTIRSMSIRGKHVDDHAVWIDPTNPEHLWVGCDGGLYETFDRGEHWRHTPGLSITQFYRVAVDNDVPFYNVYGGTQDNNTLGGPSRTTEREGVIGQHWRITTGGDGFEPAVDPENPDIIYSQSQYGGLVRYDRRSGETVSIRPREGPREEPYVFNWDSPLLISPHSNTRLYFGGDRIFRSDDRGDSWTVISPKLSRGIDRNTLEVMGRIQPPEAVDKHQYTSIWGSIVSISESPLVEGLLYAGTDDGLMHVSGNGGETWRAVDAFPGVPHMTYISDIEASRHDLDTVYASFNNHKDGDFNPYVLRSRDRGQTWIAITGDLPERHVVHALAEDHIDPDFLFAGTEFACFWTRDSGKSWHKVDGMPTIAVRDIEIQRRENDLVMATFGRGFYILDDYSPIRDATDQLLKTDTHIFPVKDALRYIPDSRYPVGWQGVVFQADNPPFGAIFTIHLKDVPQTLREQRDRHGGELTAENYPSIDQLRAEDLETSPQMFLTIRDEAGETVNRIDVGRRKGLQRVSWDLRWAGVGGRGRGPLAAPGTYAAQLGQMVEGEVTHLGEPRGFQVVDLARATFGAEDPTEALKYQYQAQRLYSAVQGASRALGELRARHSALTDVITGEPGADLALLERLHTTKGRLDTADIDLSGDRSAARRQLPTAPSISERARVAFFDQLSATSMPTRTQRDQYRYASEALTGLLDELRGIDAELAEIESALDATGAPWTPGRIPQWPPDGG